MNRGQLARKRTTAARNAHGKKAKKTRKVAQALKSGGRRASAARYAVSTGKKG